MECLLGDEDIWCVALEYRLKRAKPFDPTVDRPQTFTDVVFLMVAVEWVLVDEDVWSVDLEYQLKRAIPFHPIIGSRSNFYIGCFP
jgi:hypothetical protein